MFISFRVHVFLFLSSIYYVLYIFILQIEFILNIVLTSVRTSQESQRVSFIDSHQRCLRTKWQFILKIIRKSLIESVVTAEFLTLIKIVHTVSTVLQRVNNYFYIP
jgi:hypothetical protein